MFVVTYVTGYEYHDDYIQLGGEQVVSVEDPDVYNFAEAERAVQDYVFSQRNEDEWVRILSIVSI